MTIRAPRVRLWGEMFPSLLSLSDLINFLEWGETRVWCWGWIVIPDVRKLPVSL